LPAKATATFSRPAILVVLGTGQTAPRDSYTVPSPETDGSCLSWRSHQCMISLSASAMTNARPPLLHWVCSPVSSLPLGICVLPAMRSLDARFRSLGCSRHEATPIASAVRAQNRHRLKKRVFYRRNDPPFFVLIARSAAMCVLASAEPLANLFLPATPTPYLSRTCF
jgi:hypothetical protein